MPEAQLNQQHLDPAKSVIGVQGDKSPLPSQKDKKDMPALPSTEIREITSKDGAPMVLVPAGEFLYGDNDRRLSLPTFYMDKYEVTTKLYAQFMQATNHKPPAFWELVNLNTVGDRPVMGMEWNDAVAYCQYYGKRLPTEQEWEKAARGTDGRFYPWGNEKPSSRSANYFSPPPVEPRRSGNDYVDRITPVGKYEAGKSPYGVYDLAGNLEEWTDSDYENGGKVVRGGSYRSAWNQLRSTYRTRGTPEARGHLRGFRCVQDATK